MTVRDNVWDSVLKRLCTDGSFATSDLGFADDRQRVRRVLKEMEDLGWLQREDNRASIWEPGELAILHLELPFATGESGGD